MKCFTTHGLATILFLIFAFVCLTACTGEGERLEQVRWTAQERCDVLWNKDCWCIEHTTEEWQRPFSC